MKQFNNHLYSLSCKGCHYFKDSKCSHSSSLINEEEKKVLVDKAINKGDKWSLEWAQNIDQYFACECFLSKQLYNR